MLHTKDTHQDGEEAEYAIVSIDYVPAKTYYDMDDPASAGLPFDSRWLGDIEAIKCDNEYFLVAEGSDDLSKVATNENRIDEVEVLGTEGMLKKYLGSLQHETIEVG